MIAQIIIALIAVLHIYILWLEMFAWDTRGKQVFRGALAPELFTPTKVMAANQGLYNGFLAAGLVWSLCIQDAAWSTNVATFFLLCIAVAGIYGAYSASRMILYVQTIPAFVALCFIWIG